MHLSQMEFNLEFIGNKKGRPIAAHTRSIHKRIHNIVHFLFAFGVVGTI